MSIHDSGPAREVSRWGFADRMGFAHQMGLAEARFDSRTEAGRVDAPVAHHLPGQPAPPLSATFGHAMRVRANLACGMCALDFALLRLESASTGPPAP